MLRPNGSVIGRFSATGELNAASVIQYALSRRQQTSGVAQSSVKGQSMHDVFGVQSAIFSGAVHAVSANQRVGAAGPGNAESAGAGGGPFRAFCFFGFRLFGAAPGGG